jgi:hypothetical protein
VVEDGAVGAWKMSLSAVERPREMVMRPGVTTTIFTSMFEMSKAHIRRLFKGPEVSLVRMAPGLRAAKHVIIMTVHNEAMRLPFVLKYYRAMGFEHFIFIDNKSSDGTQEMLSAEPDVSLFVANGSYRHSRFGCDWVNSILSAYCKNKWILCVDADEFLVFPSHDSKGISNLTNLLTKNGQTSMQCLMLDMYSDQKQQSNLCPVGEDPLSVCRFYDRDGYTQKYDAVTQTTWIKGGVRGRVYFAEDVWQGPALNKTPLVFWKLHYAFLKSTHQLWPFHLNGGDVHHGKLRGVLLHFKFLSDWQVKLSNESARQQHTEEYNAYVRQPVEAQNEPVLMGPPSVEYTGIRALQRDGLIDGAYSTV